MPARSRSIGASLLVLAVTLGVCLAADVVHRTGTKNGWKQHDVARPKPPVVEPAASPVSIPAPRDAVILFDGTGLENWQTPEGKPARWKTVDGYMEVSPGAGAIQTKAGFGDVQLHVEWASPNPPEGTGQNRGNSGIFLMGVYELQVLDSFRADTYADGQAGAIYGQCPPLFNASRPPGQWQIFDIAFRRPRFDSSGKLLEPARVTLVHNGILVQNNEELLGQTNWLKWLPYESTGATGPIQLQDHGHPVRFRNIWLRELPERPTPTAKDLERPSPIAVSAGALDRFVSEYVMDPKSPDSRTKVSRDSGHLLVTFPYRAIAYVFEPIAETVFDMPDTDGRLTFQADAQGRVTGAVFKIGDQERVLKRVDPR